MEESKLSDIWIAALAVLVWTSMLAVIIKQFALVSAAALLTPANVAGVVIAATFASIAASIKAIEFLGPRRNSFGELNWHSGYSGSYRQIFQAVLLLAVILGGAGIVEYLVAEAGAIPTRFTWLLCTAILFTLILGVPFAEVSQRGNKVVRTRQLTALLLIGAATTLVLTALNLGLNVLFWFAIAWFTLSLIFLIATGKRSFAMARSVDFAPRWELLAANARVDSLYLSTLDMNFSHYRGMVDANTKTRFRPLPVHRLGKTVAFYLTLCWRNLRKLLPLVSFIIFLSIITPQILFPSAGQVVVIVGSIAIAVSLSTALISWLDDLNIPRLFSATVNAPTATVFLSLFTIAGLVSTVGSVFVVVSLAEAARLVLVCLLATTVTMLGRANVFERRKQVGPAGAMLMSQEFGPIPLGAIETAFAGWATAAASAIAVWFIPNSFTWGLILFFTARGVGELVWNRRRYSKPGQN